MLDAIQVTYGDKTGTRLSICLKPQETADIKFQYMDFNRAITHGRIVGPGVVW